MGWGCCGCAPRAPPTHTLKHASPPLLPLPSHPDGPAPAHGAMAQVRPMSDEPEWWTQPVPRPGDELGPTPMWSNLEHPDLRVSGGEGACVGGGGDGTLKVVYMCVWGGDGGEGVGLSGIEYLWVGERERRGWCDGVIWCGAARAAAPRPCFSKALAVWVWVVVVVVACRWAGIGRRPCAHAPPCSARAPHPTQAHGPAARAMTMCARAGAGARGGRRRLLLQPPPRQAGERAAAAGGRRGQDAHAAPRAGHARLQRWVGIQSVGRPLACQAGRQQLAA